MISEYELKATEETNRFLTTNKNKAFELRDQLSKNSQKTWHIGIAIRDRIVIDIDTHDENNLKTVLKYYTSLYNTRFQIIKTHHGYHLIQKESTKDRDFLQYNRCRLLVPFLVDSQKKQYIAQIEAFFEIRKTKNIADNLTLSELKERSKEIPQKARETGLVYPQGDIDILHALLGILRQKYILRITKKKNEVMEYVDV